MGGDQSNRRRSPRRSKNPQAAFDFIAWQADQGQQLTWVNKSGFLPSRKDLKTPTQPNAQFSAIEAYFLAQLPHAVIRYGAPLTAKLQQAIEDAIANASTLGTDPAKALAAVQTAHESDARSSNRMRHEAVYNGREQA